MNIRRYILIPARSVFFGRDDSSLCLRKERHDSQTTNQKFSFFYILSLKKLKEQSVIRRYIIFSCQELGEEIDTTLVFVGYILS